MRMDTVVRQVDQSAIKVNQAFIVVLLAIAFIGYVPALAGFVAVVMLVGALFPRLALFQAIYRHVLRPLGLVRPDVHPDNPEPHRFAQGVGGTLTAVGTLLLLFGSAVLGWALVMIVDLLAMTNLLFGFCAGCFMYYQLNRLGVPGFRHSPVERG